MIEVRIPKEIKEYEDKIFFGLTVRQLISSIIAGVVSIFAYVYFLDYINEEILSYFIIIFDCFILSIGWVKYNGMRMEQFMFVFMEHMIYPQKRIYDDDNIFVSINKDVKKEFYKPLSIKERIKGNMKCNLKVKKAKIKK